MGQLATAAANGLWVALNLPGSIAFRWAARDIEAAQQHLLKKIMRSNAATAIGRRYGFAAIDSLRGYQQHVPLSDYADYAGYVERIADGERCVLTAAPVTLLEPTSGSTSATKLIPYTAPLKAAFGRAIAPWIVDLYRREPALLLGQAYWSVTPVAERNRRSPGGIPIGFEEDSAYFGALQSALVRALMAVPPQVKLISDLDSFRYVTLLFLLQSQSLALISVWNPSYLELLLDQLPRWGRALARDLSDGRISAPGALDLDLQRRLEALLVPDRRRAELVLAALKVLPDRGALHRLLWPHLRHVSCWADASAADGARRLAGLLPQASVAGKGLLSTEGVASFPLAGQPGAALAIRSHVFEFLSEGGGEALLAHQVAVGGRYEVVLTTGGGLYRYRTSDLVEIVGWWRGCPLLRFLGRSGGTVDLRGEKLHEIHVREAIGAACAALGIAPVFAMLAPEERGPAAHYVLFIEAAADDAALAALAEALDLQLQQNFHYRYARQLGQLAPPGIARVERGQERYLAGCVALGQRLGDIKPTALHRDTGWRARFGRG